MVLQHLDPLTPLDYCKITVMHSPPVRGVLRAHANGLFLVVVVTMTYY